MRASTWTAGTALALGLWASAASARPFTADDLLHQETFGIEAVDSSGRWLAFERRDPYDTARRFDGFFKEPMQLSRAYLVDLAHPGPARPLLAHDPGPGVNLAGFSPSGAYVALIRYDGRHVNLGISTVATGAVRWFKVTPEESDWSRGLQWLSDDKLLVIERPDRSPPWSFRINQVSALRVPKLWAATATGGGGRTVVGSGAYIGLRSKPAPNRLLRIDAATGEVRELARGQIFDLQASPDRHYVALFSAGADIQPRADGPVQGDAGLSVQLTNLSLLDLATGRRSWPCPGDDALPHLLTWSPSGRSLLVFVRHPQALWSAGRLLRVDARTGRTAPVAPELRPALSLRPEVVRVGWMGEDPILLARPAGSARADWYRISAAGPLNLTRAASVAPSSLAALGPGGFAYLLGGELWRASADGVVERVQAIAPALIRAPRRDVSVQRQEVRPPAGSWVETGPPEARRLQWLAPDGLRDAIPVPAAAGPVLVASRQRRAALVTEVDAHEVAILRLVRSNGPARALATLNAGWAAIDAPIVRPVRHLGPDGQPLTSWLYLPRHSATPPPLVVIPYSGLAYPQPPRDAPGDAGFVLSKRMLVGHGYAVLVPSLPLPRHHKDQITGLAERIDAVVDAAAADPDLTGAFDPQRVALWGHSFGGYTAMAAIAQTDRFRAAVSIAGVSDFLAKWAAILPPWRAAPEAEPHNNWSTGSVESGQEEMGGPPWTDPQGYLRDSPLLWADRIHTPLLLVHGDQDVIPLEQSEAMFSALYRQGKDAILVTEWGENHLILNPGNVRDLYVRAFAFLDRNFGRPINAAGARPPSRAPGPASSEPSSPALRPRAAR